MSRFLTVARDDVALQVEIAEPRARHKPPLLLIHGTTTDASLWTDTRGELGEDRVLYLLNRRGRGGSSDGQAYAIEKEGEDIAATLAAISAQHEGEHEAEHEPGAAHARIDVVAHSFGSLCFLKALPAASQYVGRAVIYEPPLLPEAYLPKQPFIEALYAEVAAGRNEAVVESFFRAIERLNDRQLAKLRSMSSWPMRVAAAPTIPRELEAVCAYELPPLEKAALDFSTLFLVGALSPDFMHRASERVEACFPRAHRETLPGQRHGAMNSAPALFVDALRAFLV